VLVLTHTMPGDGGVCGVTVEVLLEVVDFAVVEAGVATGVVLAVVVLAGAAGAGVDVEEAEVFVELVAGVLDAVVVEVPPADLLDLDFDVLVLAVEPPDELVVAGVVDPAVVVGVPFAELFALDFFDFFVVVVVELLDEGEELEELLGACDLTSMEETTPISRANKTEGTTLFRTGKVIFHLLGTRSAQAGFVRYRHLA
jgi:hypothetical protein